MSTHGFNASGVPSIVEPDTNWKFGGCPSAAVFFQNPKLPSITAVNWARVGGSCQMIPPRSTPKLDRLSPTGVSVVPIRGMSYRGVRGAHHAAAVGASRDW